MAPEEVRRQIQQTYIAATRNRSTQVFRSGDINRSVFREIVLFGRDAGLDFIKSRLNTVINEAIEEAKCQKTALVLSPYGFGNAAIEGMAEALRELTDLQVDVNHQTISIIWGDNSPRLV